MGYMQKDSGNIKNDKQIESELTEREINCIH